MEGPLLTNTLAHHLSRSDINEAFAPPPTFSRLPPDGHEFPPEYRDPASSSYHQTMDTLSRKSSNGSVGSLDRSDFLLDKLTNDTRSRPILRHDENSVSGVRAKIALFSSGGQTNMSSAQSTMSLSSSTRSLNHGEVRFESADGDSEVLKGKDPLPASGYRGLLSSSSTPKLLKTKKESMSAADLMVASGQAPPSVVAPTPRGHIQVRSQSLLEVCSNELEMITMKKSSSLVKGGRASSSVQMTSSIMSEVTERVGVSSLEQRRKSGLAKLKGMAIPENDGPCASTSTAGAPEAKSELSTPPWKSSNPAGPKYSPAFKRKPFAVYNIQQAKANNIKAKPVEVRSYDKQRPSTGSGITVKPADQRIVKRHSGGPNDNPFKINKSDNDSDNDSAVSSGRSSLSHGSSSPPPLSKLIDRKPSALFLQRKSEAASEVIQTENPRVLKKDSIEAINRRNIIESCRSSSGNLSGHHTPSKAPSVFARTTSVSSVVKKFPFCDENTAEKEDKLFRACPPPLGRPASRSSSFTIAERKKSFEAATARLTDRHSSQDSLAIRRRGTVDGLLDGLGSRRNSNGSPVCDYTQSSHGVGLLDRAPLSRTESLASENSYPSTRSGSIVSVIERISYNKTSDEDSKIATTDRKSSPAPIIDSKPKPAPRFFDSGSKSETLDKNGEKSSDLSYPLPRKISSGFQQGRVTAFNDWSDKLGKGPDSPISVSGQSQLSGPSSTLFFTGRSSNLVQHSDFRVESNTDEVDGGLGVQSAWRSVKNSAPPTFYIPDESTEWESFDPSTSVVKPEFKEPPLVFHQHALSDRKYSVPLFVDDRTDKQSSSCTSGGVKMRDKNNCVPSRPSSLIETGGPEMKEMKVFEIGNLGDHGSRRRGRLGLQSNSHSNSTSLGSSQADLLECSTTSDTPKSPMPGSSSRELLEAFEKQENRRCVSVNDIRRAFEKAEQSLSESVQVGGALGGVGFLGLSPSHHRMSSLDSTTSEESSIPTPHNCFGSVSSLISGQNNLKDHYGSITSLASSTSLISPQELQGLIDEANQSLEESGTPAQEIMVIVLHREFHSGSIGITLAGGADYENKEITVHKVIPGTLADKDGRIQKGDRVLSINGKSTKGVTHRDALATLKAPRAEVVLVLSRSRSVTPATDLSFDRSDYPSYNFINSGRPPKILESPLDSKSFLSDLKFVDVPRGPPLTVTMKKEGTGLGFSLEGGKDSPLGDRPLAIKKIFLGGVAEKTTLLKVGDEILSVNNTDVSRMTRIEAWNFMKKLADGYVTIVVRQKIDLSKASASDQKADGKLATSDQRPMKSPSAVKNNTTPADIKSDQPPEATKVEAKR